MKSMTSSCCCSGSVKTGRDMLSLVVIPLLLAFPSATGLPQIRLGQTTLNGRSIPEFGQEFFGAIPFAEPPVGSLRFSPPVLKLDLGVTELNATQYGAACLQGLGFESTPQPFDGNNMSEDCLMLNVLRPAGTNESSSLPVLVWVYGGGFLDGEASIYNASAIVAQSILRGTPIIYVNLDYRLAALGFPQGFEAEARGATNLGNKDVVAALTWVRHNIDAFGGDRNKITVFGESAGAIIISQLLLNKTFDLARAAILESGSAASLTLLHASEREDTWQSFVSGVSECSGAPSNNTFDCLRSASSESIFNATNLALGKADELFPFPPAIDGPGGIIPDLPSRHFAQGEFARIPFISGTCLDEGTLFIPTPINSTEQIREYILHNMTSFESTSQEREYVVDILLHLYPNDPALGSPFGTGNETFGLDPQYKRVAAIMGDVAFVSLRRQLAQLTSRSGVKTFAYLFSDPQTSSSQPYLGVPHASELFYVYGAPENGQDSVILSQNIIDYWVSFATSLDPNDGRGNSSRPTWTQYTPMSESVLQLNSRNLTMIDDTFREQQISFINAYPEVLLH